MVNHRLAITVCVPVRNEESQIAGCLQSIPNAIQDVVVIDSGSTDATCDIAARHGASVVEFSWNGRTPKKRNWALRNLSFRHDWVLFLDADERLTPEFVTELQAVLPTTPHVGYWLSYTNTFLGHALRFGDRLRKLALFRRSAGEYEVFPEDHWSALDMEVHEHPVLIGSTGAIKSRVLHLDYRGLTHYISKHNEYSTWESRRFIWLRDQGIKEKASLTARQRWKYSTVDKWWLANAYFGYCLIIKLGFLDGRWGWWFAVFKKRYLEDIRLKILEQLE